MPRREYPILPLNRKLLTRLFSKIKISTERFYKGVPCWEWTGATRSGGYALTSHKYDWYLAHRFIYQLFMERVPINLDCDHLCRVRHCVNPVHIEIVTQTENKLRGESVWAKNRRKTVCKRGHELTPNPSQPGSRWCRPCNVMKQRERNERVRQIYQMYKSLG